MLTFDQSASVICFSPLAACEQELYKHVLPPWEANGSLLITGQTGRREARCHCCCLILLSGSRPDAATRVPCRHTHGSAHLAHGLAFKSKLITARCWENEFDQPGFISLPVCRKLLSAHNKTHLHDLALLICFHLGYLTWSSQTYFSCSLLLYCLGLEMCYPSQSRLTTPESTATVAPERALR